MNDYGLNIPQGYRLNRGTDLFTLVTDLRTVMLPVLRQIQIEEIARFCALILDEADLAGEPRPNSVIFDAFQAYNEHVGEIIAGRHPSCPLSRLTVFFQNDPESGDVYALAEVFHREYAEALVNMDLGEYFPYWDESEDSPRPFGITAAAWEARGGIWSRVLAGMSDDDPTGILRVDLGSTGADVDLLTETAAVHAAMPNLAQRINRALNAGNTEVGSPEELSSLMAELPGRYQHISSRLQPISLSDLTGVKAA